MYTADGKWKFVIATNGLERDRTTEEGRGVHCDEIADVQGGFFMNPANREEVARKLPKYKAIQFKTVDVTDYKKASKSTSKNKEIAPKVILRSTTVLSSDKTMK